jgi:hypothetical protein
MRELATCKVHLRTSAFSLVKKSPVTRTFVSSFTWLSREENLLEVCPRTALKAVREEQTKRGTYLLSASVMWLSIIVKM